TIVAIEGERRWPYVLVGTGAAMAMATKEQGIGLLAALAIVILIMRYRQQPATLSAPQRLWGALWSRAIAAGLIATVVATLIGNNALINPMGVVNRILDLTGHPIPGMSSRLTPLHFALFKGAAKESWYLRQLVDVTSSSFGIPIFLCAVAGLAYIAAVHRRASWCLLFPTAVYYFISLRTHDLLTLRYTLPLLPILAVTAGAVCAAAMRRLGRPAHVVVALLAVFSLAQGLDLLWLLRHDSRYQAEAWLAENARRGSRIEYYQKPVYVPRTFGFEGRSVPIDERSVEGVRARQPELIILSSAGRKSITHYWNPKWEEGQLLLERAEARAMLQAIESGELGYRKVASFRQSPLLLRNRITSLAPEITIYQHRP
ncbi:MAG TPA: hypothetical protein VEB21_17690, partial [Terriglobales bacterium]|nr:hypothetical protein [Terriglobales bacterium]